MTEPDRFDEIKDHISVLAESSRADMRRIAGMQASMLKTLQAMLAQQDEMSSSTRSDADHTPFSLT